MKDVFDTRDFQPDPDRDVREEIEAHLEMKTRELVASGLTPSEARREAERRFGRVAEIEKEARRWARARERRERGAAFLENLLRDVHFSLRGLRRRPGFAALALLTLALGIGASTTVFSVADAALFQSLPFADAEGLVLLEGAYLDDVGPQIRGASIPESRDWASRNRTLEGAAAFSASTFTLTGGTGAERVMGEMVDQGYFALLRVTPLRGRTFSPEETLADGGPAVALVGESLWERRWGGDPALLGRVIRLDDQPYTVVGILPESFRGASLLAEVWVPLAAAVPERMHSRDARWLSVVGRMGPGQTPGNVQRDLDGVAASLREAYPVDHDRRGVVVRTAREAILGNTRLLILIVFGATGLLLVISAINVTNLLLVRAAERREEMAVRTAVGAGRGRLMRQLLTESLILSLLGSGLGLLMAVWGVRTLPALLPPDLLPPFVSPGVDGRILLFAAGAMAMVGVAVGLGPALLASGSGSAAAIRGRGRDGGRRPGLQGSLVVGEVALSLLLLVAAGLLTRSLQAQLDVDPGFQARGLLAFRIELGGESYPGEARVAAVTDLRARLESQPGVEEVAFGSNLPMRGLSSASYLWLPDRQSGDDRVRFYHHRIGPGYLETLGVNTLVGRGISSEDVPGNPDVAVISRAFAERFFPASDPVGQTLNLFEPGQNPVTIVGVTSDVRFRGLTTDPMDTADDPDLYLPWMAIPSSTVEFLVRTRERPESAYTAIGEIVRAFDPDLVPYRMESMSDALRSQTGTARSASVILVVFSLAALALSAVGVYGILSYLVRRRRREMAIRVAVGASRRTLVRMVVVRSLALVGLGTVLGLAGAAMAGRTLSAFLYQVAALDLPTYAVTVSLVCMAALAATIIPALRAAGLDPQTALREE